MKHTKYQAFPKLKLTDRTWPDQQLTAAPIWCSTDLRDGNQALEVPMNLSQKLSFYEHLIGLGFKEIEVSFPSASETEYQLVRTLIEENKIPEDVTIQVFTQARSHLIERTFASVRDARKAIVHLYNATSPLHRDVVFGMSKQQVIDMAVEGAREFVKYAEKYGKEKYQFQYSPETFNATELDFAVEICNAVLDVWQPFCVHPVIINLPLTVELATPNVYADQIEYMCRHLKNRENVIVSLHAHNDRGCGIAAAELALLAGADRVEGTLFGNGERTGNTDLTTMALNFYTQGIDPGLDFSRIDDTVSFYEDITGMPVHPRHPYAGSLVYTAFSGSHQDAIKKGMANRKDPDAVWEMPYLTIDPKDVGRNYEAIIRVNSQSGKGGVFYLLEQNYGITPPKPMQQEFSALVTEVSDEGQKELQPHEIYSLFSKAYVNVSAPYGYKHCREHTNGETRVEVEFGYNHMTLTIQGTGNGLLDAFCNAIRGHGRNFDIVHYSEHAVSAGSGSRAMAYIGIKDAAGHVYYGAGDSASVSKASLKAVLSAVNRMLTKV